MKELLIALAQGLVNDPEAVSVTVDEPNEDGIVFYHLRVAQDDMGRVIGKQGRIAKAIRAVVKAAGQKSGTRWSVDILETDKADEAVIKRFHAASAHKRRAPLVYANTNEIDG